MYRKFILFLLAPALCFGSVLLDLLEITPSNASVDFVENKTSFQLHPLLTEKRHPNTLHLSETMRRSTSEGLKALLSVDLDISTLFRELAERPEKIEQAACAAKEALAAGHRLYIYGCGATGRLAKQMESTFWRPHAAEMQEQVVGEMTGGDRALISSLEGFEDLLIIGKKQLIEHGIEKGDVVFAITEGGETSSVIGTILAARNMYHDPKEAAKHLYFIYNNPDEVLLPLERSRAVLEDPAITKICLATGPQAITGSTRMQATTSETFVMGIILETALESQEESISEKLLSFTSLQEAVYQAADDIAKLTEWEAKQKRTVYLANEALMTVFIDVTERAPTFRLAPLDPTYAKQKASWTEVKTFAPDQKSAWKALLKRPFRGLNETVYAPVFEKEITDPFLKKTALCSLKNAGDDQQDFYDFSFDPENEEGTLLILFEEEEVPTAHPEGVICLGTHPQSRILPFTPKVRVNLTLPERADPIGLRRHIGLKMMLNAHSTAVMASLGRVVGNTMTHVNPGNLKLIGRATYLIQLHVNDHLSPSKHITYAEASALLFDAIAAKQKPEVGLAIIRALETIKTGEAINWDKAQKLYEKKGLEPYLLNLY